MCRRSRRSDICGVSAVPGWKGLNPFVGEVGQGAALRAASGRRGGAVRQKKKKKTHEKTHKKKKKSIKKYLNK